MSLVWHYKKKVRYKKKNNYTSIIFINIFYKINKYNSIVIELF